MTLVLVEGPSDLRALEVLARRRGVDLRAAAVRIEVLGGITNLARRIVPHVPARPAAGTVQEHGGLPEERLLVLHDAGETPYVERAVARSGLPVETFVCDADLEDELVRGLGVPRALEVVAAAGDLERWETLTRQPFHRERPAADVLRRFLGTTSGRKVRYAELLVDAAVGLDRVPAPLQELLSAAIGRASR